MSYVSRWAKPSSEPTASEKPAVFLNRAADGLVNTSLPAQRAPKLAPTTLAAATLTTPNLKPMEASEKYRSYTKPTDEKRRVPLANVESVDEFPSLGKAPQKDVPKAPKASDPRPAMNFASLSRDWAQKQKEDEEKAKEEKEKQRVLDYMNHREQMRRAKDDEVLRKSGVFGIRIPSKKTDSDEEKYEDAYKSENSDEPYLSDDQYADDAYEEEEEEEEYDGGWNQRKHRDEMY
jgi:hypothetical protein